jgi:hypothetical protein
VSDVVDASAAVLLLDAVALSVLDQDDVGEETSESPSLPRRPPSLKLIPWVKQQQACQVAAAAAARSAGVAGKLSFSMYSEPSNVELI